MVEYQYVVKGKIFIWFHSELFAFTNVGKMWGKSKGFVYLQKRYAI